jgi:ribose-phosphate pyrophosphokinase
MNKAKPQAITAAESPRLGRLQVFAMQSTAELGGNIARALRQRIAAHEERAFEDGEHKVRPLDPVGGADVYILQSTHGGPHESANDKLCRLLFFIGALRDAGAARVTTVVPYLCYARKDRRTKPNDPVTTRYVASLFGTMGTDCIVTLEVRVRSRMRFAAAP